MALKPLTKQEFIELMAKNIPDDAILLGIDCHEDYFYITDDGVDVIDVKDLGAYGPDVNGVTHVISLVSGDE